MARKPGTAPLPAQPDALERICERLKADTSLNPNVRYFFYVAHHKYCVYRAGRFMGLGILRLLVHDWQKYTRAEWAPYVNKFYRNESPRRSDGGYDPTTQGDEFMRAFHHHVAHGSHHWQYWIMPAERGGFKILEMDENALLEMVSDWMGAGRSIAGTWNPNGWYSANADKMHLHAESRGKVNHLLRSLNVLVPA